VWFAKKKKGKRWRPTEVDWIDSTARYRLFPELDESDDGAGRKDGRWRAAAGPPCTVLMSAHGLVGGGDHLPWTAAGPDASQMCTSQIDYGRHGMSSSKGLLERMGGV
jgi:hypothetical protein